ncbi:DMT family transporter [Agrobacterium sp. rho-13.3]|uniref:DMT family transporter n=1 Tax=Agrobacterium sp. rho-13.3 TaxID=3072980 RepID=UPI002A16A911|nr:DMT family transporter [Agrobacterium sp. rho-13.3]MDX8309150.1 DMT family transporter [Agrobacterium sp. rho-13.3]
MTNITLGTSRPVLLPALAVAGTVFTWSASFAAIGYALRAFEPLPMASIRFALAAIFALAWIASRRPRSFLARDYGILAVSGVLGIAAYNVLLNSGQTTISAGAAGFIVNTQPLFMVLLAVPFLKERFSRWSWIGALLGFSGVAIIASGQPGGLAFGTGSTLIVLAAACAASYSILQRPLFRRAAPLDVTAFVIIAGAVALLPWLPAGLAQARVASNDTLLMVAFLAIGPGIIGQSCWTYALKTFGAARAGQFLYLIPPCSVGLAWLVLGEVPQISTLIGGGLALTGVVIVNSWGRRS